MKKLRNYALIAEVVGAVRDRQRTASALQRLFAADCTLMPMQRLLRRLLDHRIIYVARWRGRKGNQRVYALGDKPSAPHYKLPLEPAPVPLAHVDRFAVIWQALETPMSVLEITEECGGAIGNNRRLIQRLHHLRLVGVADWDTSHRNGPRIALYQRGVREDAPYPPLVTEHETYVRQKARRMALEQHKHFTFRGDAAQPGASL